LARIVIPTPVPDQERVYVASWSPGGDAAARIALDVWDVAVRKWDRNQDGRLSRSEIDNAGVLDRFFRMDLDQDEKLDQREWERHAAVFQRAQNALLALRLDGSPDPGESAVVWKYSRGVPYVSTPILFRGILWMVKDGGIVTVLNAATGERLSEERLPGQGNYAASPVLGDGKIYFASVPGVLSVVRAQPDWQVVSSHDFQERIFATPVIDHDRILVRTERAVYMFAEP
jgi:outer membrane protein assembly factor BamB